MFLKYANLLRRSAPRYQSVTASLNQFRVHDFYQDSVRNLITHNRGNLLQFTPSSFVIARAMSSEPIKNIDIAEYLKLKEEPNTVIIDVREVSEIAETGILPGGINIPLGEISDALQKNAAVFEKTYKRAKPSDNDRIIFSCRSGKRSMMAAQAAQKLGYENVLNLAGGWLAWEEYSKK